MNLIEEESEITCSQQRKHSMDISKETQIDHKFQMRNKACVNIRQTQMTRVKNGCKCLDLLNIQPFIFIENYNYQQNPSPSLQKPKNIEESQEIFEGEESPDFRKSQEKPVKNQFMFKMKTKEHINEQKSNSYRDLNKANNHFNKNSIQENIIQLENCIEDKKQQMPCQDISQLKTNLQNSANSFSQSAYTKQSSNQFISQEQKQQLYNNQQRNHNNLSNFQHQFLSPRHNPISNKQPMVINIFQNQLSNNIPQSNDREPPKFLSSKFKQNWKSFNYRLPNQQQTNDFTGNIGNQGRVKGKPSNILTNFRNQNQQYEEEKNELNFLQENTEINLRNVGLPSYNQNTNIFPKKHNSFFQQNQMFGVNIVTPTSRKKQSGLISNTTVKNLLMKYQNQQYAAAPETPGIRIMNSGRKITNYQDFGQVQASIAKLSHSEYENTPQIMSNRQKKKSFLHHQQEQDSMYQNSFEPSGLFDSPPYLEQQFDQSRHESYLMSRANALTNNREQIIRNVSELKKIKKKKKSRRLESFKSKKTFLQRSKGQQSFGGLARGTIIAGNGTFKKDYETTSNGSETSEQEDEDPMQIIENNLQKSKFILFPNSTVKFLWDIFMILSIVTIAIIVPLNLSFGLGDFPMFILHFLEFIMICDVFVNMNSGYYTKGMLIMQRKQIIQKYLKSWFFLDFISAIPGYSIYSIILKDCILNSIDELLTGKETIHTIKVKDQQFYKSQVYIFVILQFTKVLKITKFSELQARVYDFIKTDKGEIFFKAFKLSFIIFMVAHWLGCIFRLVGGTQDHMEEKTWIRPYVDLPTHEQYVNSIYWAITTMVTVGYGDITPRNTYERLVTILNMCIASGIYAYIINEISSMVRLYNTLASKYEESMKYVNRFMKQKGIPEDLRLKIVRYLEYNWEQKKKIKIEENEVYHLLNDNLRDKITLYINGRILRNIKIFDNFSIEFISRLTFVFKKQSFAVDEIIFNEDTFGQDMFFICNGKVYIIHKKTMSFVKELYKDDHFGDIGFFTNLPRQATIKAKDYTDTLILSKENFLKVAENDFQALRQYYQISCSVDEITKNFNQLSIKCYVCNKSNHIFSQCSKFSQSMKGNLIPFIVKSELAKYKEQKTANFFKTIGNFRSFKKRMNQVTSTKGLDKITTPKNRQILDFDNSQRMLLSQNKQDIQENTPNQVHSDSFDCENENQLKERIKMQLQRKNMEYNKVPHNTIQDSLLETDSVALENDNQQNYMEDEEINYQNAMIQRDIISQGNSFQYGTSGTYINILSGDEMPQDKKSQAKLYKELTQKLSYKKDFTKNQIIEENSSSASSSYTRSKLNFKDKRQKLKIIQKCSSLQHDKLQAADLLRMSGEIIPIKIKDNDQSMNSPFKQLSSPKKSKKLKDQQEMSSLQTEQFNNNEIELFDPDQVADQNNYQKNITLFQETKSKSLFNALKNPQEVNSPLLSVDGQGKQKFKHKTDFRNSEHLKSQSSQQRNIISKNYTRLIREHTNTTINEKQYQEAPIKNIQKNIKKKPKASRIQQRDIFNNKFFVEDFLDEINSATMLDYDNQLNNDTANEYKNDQFLKICSSKNVIHQQALAFKRKMSSKGNIGVGLNPYHFINQSKQISNRQQSKFNIKRLLSDSSPISSEYNFNVNKNQKNRNTSDSLEMLIKDKDNFS